MGRGLHSEGLASGAVSVQGQCCTRSSVGGMWMLPAGLSRREMGATGAWRKTALLC